MASNTRQIRLVLYRLKRTLPTEVLFLESIKNEAALKTGVTDREYRRITIKRCIVMSGSINRKFVQDLAYIAANKNFTEGGYFDTTDRIVIVDGKDLPSDWVPTLNDQCQFNSERYEIAKASKTIDNRSWLLSVKFLKGVPVLTVQIFDKTQIDTLSLGQTVAHVVV